MINSPLDVAAIPILIILILLYSLPFYILLSLPALLLLFLIMKYHKGIFSHRALLLSIVITAFMSPYYLHGHNPLLLPLPFGIMVAISAGRSDAMIMSSISVLFGISLCFFMSRHYLKKERLGLPVKGMVEILWRNNIITG